MPLRTFPALLSWLSDRAARATREIAVLLAAVLLVGLAAAQMAPAPALEAAGSRTPLVMPAASPTPERAGRLMVDADRPVEVEVPEPAVATVHASGSTPTIKAPAPERAPVAVDRWLPSGTGMWLHDWKRSEGGNAQAVVARAQQAGLTHLYVQTGSSKKGWIGQEVLSELLPAVRGTGIKVIAWDFPKLDDPEKDARRLARAAFWTAKGADMVAAVAPDVETRAEGTNVTAERVRRYYAALRAALPKRTAILATVPWPSEKRTKSYPYATTAPYTDAWIPMAYWYNRSPSTVTVTSMRWLARFGKPVMPVGQGYDGRIDAPYLLPDPHPDKSVAAFAFVARQHGAKSLSLWSWQTTGSLQWGVLQAQAQFFAPTAAEGSVPSAAPPATSPADSPATGPEKATHARAPGRKHRRKG